MLVLFETPAGYSLFKVRWNMTEKKNVGRMAPSDDVYCQIDVCL
jgi:hypothetical protein